MSEEKRLKARVVHKHKTEADWWLDVYDSETGEKRSDPFIPLNGELIIFDPDENHPTKRFKFGDGVTDVIELEFSSNSSSGGGGDSGNIVDENNNVVINEGDVDGKYSIVFGTADEEVIEALIGNAINYLDIEIKAPEVNADMVVAIGTNLEVNSSGSTALGIINEAGAVGYYWHSFNADKKQITVSTSRPSSSLDSAKAPANLDKNWKVGDYLTIVNSTTYACCVKIAGISGNVITVDSNFPFTEDTYKGFLGYSYTRPFDRTICAIGKETVISANDTVRWTCRPGEVSISFGSIVMGAFNTSTGTLASARGRGNLAAGNYSDASGEDNEAHGYRSQVSGRENKVIGHNTRASGYQNEIVGDNSEASGWGNKVTGKNAKASGQGNQAIGDKSEAGGYHTIASGENSVADGNTTRATAANSKASGQKTTAASANSTAKGNSSNLYDPEAMPNPTGMTPEEFNAAWNAAKFNAALGASSETSGTNNVALGSNSYAGGNDTRSFGTRSNSWGWNTEARGKQASANGQSTKALGDNSRTEGQGTIASAANQLAMGSFNKEDPDALLVIGNGTSGSKRSNAFAVNKNGIVYNNKTQETISEDTSESTVEKYEISTGGLEIYKKNSFNGQYDYSVSTYITNVASDGVTVMSNHISSGGDDSYDYSYTAIYGSDYIESRTKSGYEGKEETTTFYLPKHSGTLVTDNDLEPYVNKNEVEWLAVREWAISDQIIIPEQTISGGLWSNVQISIQVGLFYNVFINGTAYTCEAFGYDGEIMLGNVPDFSRNEYPFSVTWVSGANGGFFFKDSSVYPSNVTLKVTGPAGYEYSKLPEEFLPTSVVKSINGIKPNTSGNIEFLKNVPEDVVVQGAGEQLMSCVVAFDTDAAASTGKTIDGAFPAELNKTYWLVVNNVYHKCHWVRESITSVLYDDEDNSVWIKKQFNGTYIKAPTAGTYMYRLYDSVETQMVKPDYLPPNLATIDDLGQAGSGNANIDVTAEVGQAIVIKEVDENGKPTKWEAADHQQKICWDTWSVVQPTTTLTGAYNESLGAPLAPLEFFDISVENTYKVTFDGVEYVCKAIAAHIQGFDITAFGNAMLAGGENTGEPFAVFVSTYDVANNIPPTIVFLDMDSHTICIEGEGARKIPTKYVPSLEEMREYEDVVLPETVSETVYVEVGITGIDLPISTFVPTKYKINYNGTEYICSCTLLGAGAGAVIGNLGLVDETYLNTGEPFIIISAEDDVTQEPVCTMFCFDNAKTVTVTITQYHINPIPQQHLTNAFPLYIEATAEWDGDSSHKPTNYTFTTPANVVANAVSLGREVKLRVKLLGHIYADAIYNLACTRLLGTNFYLFVVPWSDLGNMNMPAYALVGPCAPYLQIVDLGDNTLALYTD